MPEAARPRFLALLARWILTLALVGGIAVGAYATREHWLPVLFPKPSEAVEDDHDHDHAAPSEQVMLSVQAQKNLKLTSLPLKVGSFWKTITVPGIVIDRPGFSDRSVVAPVTGVVTQVHKIAGDHVKPGEVLFTLKLLSEALHLTQTELFKAAQDVKLAEAQRKRLLGTVNEARIIEIESQIARLEVAIKAYRQELINRGLLTAQIDGVAEGKFVSEMSITAPSRAMNLALEVQEVKVELGQQVLAGQTLCLLANHQMLAVEGRAFREESPLIERAVKEGWPIEIDFDEDPGHGWDAHGQTFHINYIANTIDQESRTFRFVMPLENQSRLVEKNNHRLWRFRPGQRVRLLVRVEEIKNVFVLPPDAVAKDGADAYVFRQNGDNFDRKPVNVIYRDRQAVVIAHDGSVTPGVYVAQTGATQLNRMVKSQSGTTDAGFHIHADGSVHAGKH
jgi:membrane fusion protein, heavy metal efflux system